MQITARPLDAEAFAPFGEVLTARPTPSRLINRGRCERHHALATVQRGGGEAILSIFRSEGLSLPYSFDLLERHPLGSQAFMPMSDRPWLVIVAPDQDSQPGTPLAFIVPPHVGVSLHAGTWHGVLTPLGDAADFLVIDREGSGNNLEEVEIPVVTVVA